LTQTSSSGTVTTNVAAWTVVLALVIGHWLGRRYGILIIAAAGETLISTTIKVLADRRGRSPETALTRAFRWSSFHTCHPERYRDHRRCRFRGKATAQRSTGCSFSKRYSDC
jgi:hypothetical protein